MEGTTGQTHAGAASTKEPARLRVSLWCDNAQPEFRDDMNRVLEAFGLAVSNDDALQNALYRLSQDTMFAIMVQGPPSQIILPSTRLVKP